MLERRYFTGIAIFAVLLLAGCAAAPQKELKAYQEAFDQARTATQEVLLDYSAAKIDLEKRQTQQKLAKAGPPPPPPLYQFNYQPAIDQASVKKDGLSERIRALEVIARYNQVLADLAEGKSVDQVAASAGQLIKTVGSLVNIVPAAGTLLTEFAAAIEKARAREELVKAIRLGEQPVVQIVDFLVGDIPLYYQVRRDLSLLDLGVIEGRINKRVDSLEIAATGLEPTAPVDLSGYQQKINQQLSRLAGMDRRADLAPGGIANTGVVATAQSQAALTNSVLAQALIEFTNDANQYLAVTDKLNSYFNLLQRYETLLASTKQAMTKLRLAADAPQDVTQQFEDLFQTALLLRRDFIKFRSQM